MPDGETVLKKSAKLAYAFFDLRPEVRAGRYQEFFSLFDSGRWAEAELMLERLQRTNGG